MPSDQPKAVARFRSDGTMIVRRSQGPTDYRAGMKSFRDTGHFGTPHEKAKP